MQSFIRYFAALILVFAMGGAMAARASSVTVSATVVQTCFNGTIEAPEQCDGVNLNGATCGSLGYATGTLACRPNCTFDTSGCSLPSGGRRVISGGGGDFGIPLTGATFSGRAYPGSTVTLLKNADVAARTVAGSNASFNISLSGLSAATYVFSLYSEDANGNRSSLYSFTVTLTEGAITNVSGVFIAPTITADKSQVKRGDILTILGQTVPKGTVTITVNSNEELFFETNADPNGAYAYSLDTAPLDFGAHLAKSRAAAAGAVSAYGKAVSFEVGTENVPAKPGMPRPGIDLNGDGRVNIVDFSILAYWYKRPNPPAATDLNGDGKVTLVDFSILAYYWTG